MYTTRVDALGGVDLEPLSRHGYTPGVTVCISLTCVGSILITIDDAPGPGGGHGSGEHRCPQTSTS